MHGIIADSRAHAEDIGMHFALTLAGWRRCFLGMRDYLAYCESGFRGRYIGEVQLAMGKMHSARRLFGDPMPVEAVAAP